MCCCGKPIVNGEQGYRWNTEVEGIHPVNPPDMGDSDTLLYDEPGRCGGLDSHAYHFRVVHHYSSLFLIVRHGGGDERVRLSGPISTGLATLDSTNRYWLLSAIFHAYKNGAHHAEDMERSKWQKAAAEKRIKTRKQRGENRVKVWIASVPIVVET